MAVMLKPDPEDDLNLALFRARLRKAESCREQGDCLQAAMYECIAYAMYAERN